MRAANAKPANSSWKWWQGLLGGMLIMVSPGAAILVMALSAPAWLIMIADSRQKRILPRTAFLFALAGAIAPLQAFVTGGHDIATTLNILTGATTVLLTWACAGSGWLLNELFCVTANFATNVKLAAQRNALETSLLQIRTEWELPEDLAPFPQNNGTTHRLGSAA